MLAADPGAAGVLDGSGRLALEVAAAAGCSAEAWAVLWEGTPEDARLGWAGGYLGGVAVSDQQAVARAMTANAEWVTNLVVRELFRVLLDSDSFELITALPAAVVVSAAVPAEGS